MFKWKVNKNNQTSADLQIEEIKNLLFPSLRLESQMQSDGTSIKFHVDYSADSNLDAALMDLQEGNNDEAVHKTITSIIGRLHRIRNMLEAHAHIDVEAKYIIVEDEVDAKNYA